MRSITFSRVVAFLLLLPFAGYSQSDRPAANDQGKTVVKANTRLVVVDVVASDSKGNPVLNLKKEDFTLFEDGRPQEISIFNFQQPGTTPAQPEQHLPPNVFSNVPTSKSTSLNVVLLDALNGEFAGRAYAREQLIKFLEEGRAGQPVAVYALENHLKLLHGFTTDTREVVSAIRNYNPHVINQIETVRSAASPFTQKGEFQTGPRNIETTLAALDFLAQSLAAYPGRKNLIWLSEAFPETLFPDLFPAGSPNNLAIKHSVIPNEGGPNPFTPSQAALANSGQSLNPTQWASSDYSAQVRKVANALMNAQVAVYPIDAAGVGRLSRIPNLATMREVAERTGGKTFAGQNNLEASIRSSIDDGSTYYTLSYYPDNKAWNGQLRQIVIKTTQPGMSLRYRQGYYALDPGAPQTGGDSQKLLEDFSRAMGLDVPSATAILFQTVLASPADNHDKVVANFAINPHTLTFVDQPEGIHQANLTCAIVAFSEKGSPEKNTVATMTVPLKAEDFQKLMNTTFPCRASVELKPGKYSLRLGVLDRNSRLMGTTTASITVPIP